MIADAFISFLPSGDLGRSADFYERVLGLDLIVDQGTCRIYRVAGTAYVGVCLRDPFDEVQPVITTLVADDVDGWCARIVANGWSIEVGPEHSDGYSLYHAFFRDPDGNRLEIQRFDDPAWDTGP
jgi:catechol 2,3-dioxygenase-like lactoylglutathione lyase family enzyme